MIDLLLATFMEPENKEWALGSHIYIIEQFGAIGYAASLSIISSVSFFMFYYIGKIFDDREMDITDTGCDSRLLFGWLAAVISVPFGLPIIASFGNGIFLIVAGCVLATVLPIGTMVALNFCAIPAFKKIPAAIRQSLKPLSKSDENIDSDQFCEELKKEIEIREKIVLPLAKTAQIE